DLYLQRSPPPPLLPSFPTRRSSDLAKFPWDNIRKMADLGLLGVPCPEELGGAGLDLISYMIVIHELGKVDASHGLTISAHTTLRSEEHTSELQSLRHLVCRLLLEKK